MSGPGSASASARGGWSTLPARASAGRGRVLSLALLAGVALWLTYAISGFRLPWRPIEVSDANAGGAIRKLLFGAVGAWALFQLLCLGGLGLVLGAQRRLFALAGCVLATSLYSADPGLSLKRGLILVFAVAAVAAAVHTAREPVRRMQGLLVGGTALAAWVSLGAKLLFPAACSSILERPGLAGVTSHPNTCGIVTALGLVLSWGVSPRGASERALLWAGRAGLGLALVLAGSVTSLAFAASASGVVLALTSGSYRRGCWVLCAALGAGALASVLLSLGFGGALELVGRDASLSGRDELWGPVLRAGLEQPWFGSGFGAFWYEGRGREIVGTWNPRQAHNAYLDLFVDLGLIGSLFFVATLARILLEGWQRWRAQPGTPERRATASLIAASGALLGIYGWGESFLLKPDKLVFFALLWFLALLDRAGGSTRPLAPLSPPEVTS